MKPPFAAVSGIALRESVGNSHLVTHQEDTAVRAVSPPSMFHHRFILRTSRDASEEVSCSPGIEFDCKQGRGRQVERWRKNGDAILGCWSYLWS